MRLPTLVAESAAIVCTTPPRRSLFTLGIWIAAAWLLGTASTAAAGRLATGSYTGNGVDNRAITGVGFAPDFVIVRSETDEFGLAKTSTMAGDAAKDLGDNKELLSNRIQSLDADGFTVGTNDAANKSGVTYHWVAMKAAAGDMGVGSYTGNDTDNRDILGLGFQPDYVLVMNGTGEHSMHCFASAGYDQSFEMKSSGFKSDRIQDLLPDGFQVGGHNTVNENGAAIHWVAWRSVAGKSAEGTYTGNGNDNRNITGAGFEPEFVLMHLKDKDPVMRPASLTGDATLQIDKNAVFSDGIQTFLGDGFQVGSDDRVNRSDKPVFWTALRDEATADLQIVKSVDDGMPNEGDTITYTVEVANLGPDGATGVEVTDLLPAGVTYVSDVPSVGTYASGTGVWTVGAVANGATETLTITATVNAGTAGSTITNTASLTASDQTDTNPANDSDSADITVQGVDLAVTKSVDDGTPNEGGTVVYTVEVTNNGPDDATGVEVTDLLPAGVTYVSDTASVGTYVSSTGVWTVGAIANGVTETLTITATVDAGTAGSTITNTASLTASDQADTNPANDSDSADIMVQGVDLAVTKSVDDGTPSEGGTITYTVEVTNNGPDGATGVEVTDLLPAGVTYVSDTTSVGTYVSGTGVWTVGAVANGVTETLTITATVDAGTAGSTITNTASLTASDQADTNPANDSASADITVLEIQIATRSSAIDVSADGNEVWVVNPDHASVSVIRATAPGANTLLAEIPVGREPWCLDTHPTNGEVWVASYRDDAIYIVDAATRVVVDSIEVGFGTFGVAFDPTGGTALVTASGSDEVFAIDVASRTVTQTLNVYRRPRGIVWRPDGLRAWVTHLLTPGYAGRLTVVDATDWTTSEINVQQVFGNDEAGYPSIMQNANLAPGDSLLWIPATLINSAKGELNGHLLTPTNTFHAVIRPVNVATGTDLNWDTYFLSEGGTPRNGYSRLTTPVGGSIAVDFKSAQAFVANMHSNDVTVLNRNILWPDEINVIPVGRAPIGVVAHPTEARVYVANWLSRDVTVIRNSDHSIVATVSAVTWEPVSPQVLNGKQLFFTSTGKMSLENRNSCCSCHTFGVNDGRHWDLTQFGGNHIRATPVWRGAGFTGPYGWTAMFDEIQDNEWSIRGLMGGEGLVEGPLNPSLGPPNRGLSKDLDDLSLFLATREQRPDTPFLNPDGSLTPEADSGRVLFESPEVGCATCHPAPFYTDSSPLADPYLKHDVGTNVPADTNGVAGYDTPSLVGVWDSGPYLHNHYAKTLEEVLVDFNANDEHGTTSHLSGEQIGFLVAFMNSIGWPDDPGTPVDVRDAPVVAAGPTSLDRVFPNPFHRNTSLRFHVEANASDVLVDVFDVTGRRVRTLLDRPMTRGTHIVGWDSRGERGRPVAPGIYFARLLVNGKRVDVRKMTVLR